MPYHAQVVSVCLCVCVGGVVSNPSYLGSRKRNSSHIKDEGMKSQETLNISLLPAPSLPPKDQR